MINTNEELFEYKGTVALIGDELALEVGRVCPQLKKKKVLTRHQIEIYKDKVGSNTIKMEKARESRKGKGGRHALPDLTTEEFEKLSSKEQLTYRNRIWKRNSRKDIATRKENEN